MKAKPLISAKIQIEFRSNQDLLSLFDQIQKEISAGEKNVSSFNRGLPYKIQVGTTYLEKKEVKPLRIEEINGNRCEIYPSKINQS
jgi:hypothetical protein